MATVDLWRAIESLASENWTEDAIAAALAISVRQIRKLRLLANVHPAILDRIAEGDMPKEQELRTIASASREEQAAVWKKRKPKKDEGVVWWQIAQALEKHRFFAKHARFGEDERAAFGIVWQEDLFAEGDDDNRFTVDGDAFFAAQRAWLDAHMPKNGVMLEADAIRSRQTAAEGELAHGRSRRRAIRSASSSIARDGSVDEMAFHVPEPDVKASKARSIGAHDDMPVPKKPRPEITHKGTEIIGALRTEALVKSLEVNDVRRHDADWLARPEPRRPKRH